jgi:choline dehydrogenase-like flavoprotein
MWGAQCHVSHVLLDLLCQLGLIFIVQHLSIFSFSISISRINVRSLPVDIERWNLTGWTFDNILEHYKLMETYVDSDWEQPPFWKDQEPQQNKPWRGHLGAVHTVPAGPSIDPVASLFVQSCVNSGIGLSKTQGFNDPEASARIGAGYYEFNIHNGVRDSIAAAFLGGQGGSTSSVPKNLKIRTGATVTHVVSQDAHGGGKPRAVGVHFVARKGSSEFVKLEDPKGLSEIILAAGAIITPQILTNSGIGEDGSVVDLPGVGKNLHDHPVVAMTLRLTPNIIEGSSSIYTVGVEMEDYLTSVTELMTMVEDTGGNFTRTARQRAHEQIATLGTPGFSAGAFLRSPWATDEAPDIQLTVFPRSIEPHVARKERREDTKSMRASAMVITVALLRPDARYEVRPSTTTSTTAVGSSTKQKSPIQATKSDMLPLDGNPLTQQLHFHLPSIDLPEAREQYLSDLDVERLAWGLEQVRLIGKTAPLADNTVEEIYPGPEADLQAFVRGNHLPNSHWVGSTKMGIDKDHMAVLDEALRVRGIDNLRVVDSGAIPKIPNGNIHSTVCAVASHAADMIITRRQERGERQRR